MPPLARLPAWLATGLLRTYRHTLSALIGRQCRYLPTCSEYAEEAVRRHGLWAGGWMGLARICRCGPNGGSGFDPAPGSAPAGARWSAARRYGRWSHPDELGPAPVIRCEPSEP